MTGYVPLTDGISLGIVQAGSMAIGQTFRAFGPNGVGTFTIEREK